LPITLAQSEIDKLIDDASRGANAIITIDLPNQEIRGPDGGVIPFKIDPFLKRCLMEGLDDIGLTLEKAEHIETFETESRARRPWA
jgi:3-isopropylmalate/(R)-2-methylmalate dehydratase small subunit